MAKRSFSIVFAPAPVRQLRKLSPRDQRRIVQEIESLADDPRPHSARKLIGEDNLWRIRVGHFRVVYEIQNAKLVVLVLRIAHRKDVYRK